MDLGLSSINCSLNTFLTLTYFRGILVYTFQKCYKLVECAKIKERSFRKIIVICNTVHKSNIMWYVTRFCALVERFLYDEHFICIINGQYRMNRTALNFSKLILEDISFDFIYFVRQYHWCISMSSIVKTWELHTTDNKICCWWSNKTENGRNLISPNLSFYSWERVYIQLSNNKILLHPWDFISAFHLIEWKWKNEIWGNKNQNTF